MFIFCLLVLSSKLITRIFQALLYPTVPDLDLGGLSEMWFVNRQKRSTDSIKRGGQSWSQSWAWLILLSSNAKEYFFSQVLSPQSKRANMIFFAVGELEHLERLELLQVNMTAKSWRALSSTYTIKFILWMEVWQLLLSTINLNFYSCIRWIYLVKKSNRFLNVLGFKLSVLKFQANILRVC